MSQTASVAEGSKKRRNPFARIVLFIRQVMDELRKVVWPSRSELWTYFSVVVVFVLAIMVFVGVLDLGFNRLIMWAFA